MGGARNIGAGLVKLPGLAGLTGLAGLAGLAGLVLLAGAAQAQDSRKVAEPVLPHSCVVLLAAPEAIAAGATDDTARIQGAIDKCPAGRAVRLAASNDRRAFTAGPLVLHSGVSLLVDTNATLYASTNAALFDKGQHTCGTIDKGGRGCKPFISVTGSTGSGIVGDGVIDGQGGHVVDGLTESWWQLARRAQKEDARQNVPRLIEITNSQDFTLYRITLRNSPNFHVTLNNVDGFTAWNMRIDTPATARNTDGIDPISSRNITIAHSAIRTGDDNVAIKAGNNGPTENISLLHNRFYSGHGMSIGSETNGGVRRILVDDLTLDGTTSGLRIKSDVSRGGVVDQVSYRNVCLRDVKTPIDIGTRYNARAEGTLVPVFTHIGFEHVHSVTPGRVVVDGYDEQRPVRITLSDVSVAGKADRKIANAVLSGDAISGMAGAGDACAGRFTPYPELLAFNGKPQLSAEQAKQFAYAEVLKYVGVAGRETIDPWDPLADPLARDAALKPDYTVDLAARADNVTLFNSVQAAVNQAAINTHAAGKRMVILVKPGVYKELVYVPAGPSPITLVGGGNDARATVISAKLDAAVTGAQYAAQYGAQFAATAPAIRDMYASIRDKATISTMGSMTVWVRNDGFQARNLTIENGYNKDRGDARTDCATPACNSAINPQQAIVHHQAVALQVDGADKAQFENVRLLGFQDTMYLKSPQTGTTSRSFFNKSYIEGDVDFIFGDSTAYFYQTEIRSLGDRTVSYAAAPDTSLNTKYGFVFDHSVFSSDNSANARGGRFFLLRQWFHSQKCTPYGAIPLEGYACTVGETSAYQAPKGTISKSVLESVGKMVVLNSRIGAHINRRQPWSDWNNNGTLPYRPLQTSSDDYWDNLIRAGIDPVRQLGYASRPAPALIFVGEFNNTEE